MPSTPLNSTKRRFRWGTFASAACALAVSLALSGTAQAIRRNQIPVGVDPVVEEEAPKPKPVKVQVPAAAPEQPSSTWMTAPAQPGAEPAAAQPAPRVAEDEAPAAPATSAADQPVVAPAEALLRLVFDAPQVTTGESQRLELDTLAARAAAEPDLRMTINSFASPREGQLNEARRVSLKRAMDVRSYLIGKGVAKERINVRAMGDKVSDEPKDRIDVTPL